MDIEAATIEQLDANGTIRTLLLTPRADGRLVVALPDEYDDPRDGPLHFLDEQDATRFAEAYARCRIRRVGHKKLKRRDQDLSFSTEWRGIGARRHPGLGLYVLSLPRDAMVNRLTIVDPRTGAPIPCSVVRDDARRRFTMYVESIGPLDFDLACELTLTDEPHFRLSTFEAPNVTSGSEFAANAWKHQLPKSESSRLESFLRGTAQETPPAPLPPVERTKLGRPLRILHISDLHERASFDGMPSLRSHLLALDTEERGIVLGSRFSEALLAVAETNIDIVCLTGDVADWGHPNEYTAASARLTALLETVRVPKNRFFAVPGNHDVQRRLREDAWRGLRAWHGQTHDGTQLGRWFRQVGGPPLGVSPEWREHVLERTAAFWDWLASFGRPDLVPKPPKLLGYRDTISRSALHGIEVPIHIVGLDSSWLCGDDNDQGRILLTEEQVQAHVRDGERALTDFRIALVHHPLDHLADHHRVRRLLGDGGVDVLLHGHQHEPLALESAEPGASLRIIAAGCLVEGDHGKNWPNGFQVIELDVPERSGSVHFHRWAREGRFWTKGSDIYREAQGGVLPFGARTAATSTPSETTGPSGPSRWKVVLEGTLSDLSAIEMHELVAEFRRVATLTAFSVTALRGGSIILVCDGGGALRDAFTSGEFEHAYGFRVLDVVPGDGETRGFPEAVWASLEQELRDPSAHRDRDDGEESLQSRVDKLVGRGELTAELADRIHVHLRADGQARDPWMGVALASQVRLQRLTSFLVNDFEHNYFWHLQRSLFDEPITSRPDPKEESPWLGNFLAALAVMTPEFDYELRVLNAALRSYTERHTDEFSEPIPSLSARVFVKVLRFRLSEVERVTGQAVSGGDAPGEMRRGGEWHWPLSWGHVHFNCPVSSGGFRNRDAREDRERMIRAIRRYEPQ